MQLAKSVKTDANKIAVSSILPRKDKFNNEGKEVNTHLQNICSSNILPSITHNNIIPLCLINVKDLQLDGYGDKQLPRNFTSTLLKIINIF